MEFTAPNDSTFVVEPGAQIKLPNYVTLLTQESIDEILNCINPSERAIAAGTSKAGTILIVTGDGRFMHVEGAWTRCHPSADGVYLEFGDHVIPCKELLLRAIDAGLVIKL